MTTDALVDLLQLADPSGARHVLVAVGGVRLRITEPEPLVLAATALGATEDRP